MELVIGGLDSAEAADGLSIAIIGRGAFHRFEGVLTRWPDLFNRWPVFSADRGRGRARTWLAEAGYTAGGERRSRQPGAGSRRDTPRAERTAVLIAGTSKNRRGLYIMAISEGRGRIPAAPESPLESGGRAAYTRR